MGEEVPGDSSLGDWALGPLSWSGRGLNLVACSLVTAAVQVAGEQKESCVRLEGIPAGVWIEQKCLACWSGTAASALGVWPGLCM